MATKEALLDLCTQISKANEDPIAPEAYYDAMESSHRRFPECTSAESLLSHWLSLAQQGKLAVFKGKVNNMIFDVRDTNLVPMISHYLEEIVPPHYKAGLWAETAFVTFGQYPYHGITQSEVLWRWLRKAVKGDLGVVVTNRGLAVTER
ncbi:hypothetical protein ACYPKM_04990 [Pseudomonas aeruginosa]